METILLLLLAAKLLLPNDTNAVDSKSSSLISSLHSVVSGMVSICTTSPDGSVLPWDFELCLGAAQVVRKVPGEKWFSKRRFK